jgi:hypothetical protein
MLLVDFLKMNIVKPFESLCVSQPSQQFLWQVQFFKKATFMENGRNDEHLATLLSCFVSV